MPAAPVVIFTYKRPRHTGMLLDSLRANRGVEDCDIYAFSDGPRAAQDEAAVEATRGVLRHARLSRLSVIERERNLGLAGNVIDGVTRICAEHGRVIVLEDDLVLSSTYLEYMNTALERYADDERVYHVSGYMFPVRVKAEDDAVFLPMTTCSGGWATWARAWRAFDSEAGGYAALRADRGLRRKFDLGGAYNFFDMLERQRAGKIDSWAIRWYLSVFMRDGLALFPARSLAQNIGFGDAATNTQSLEVPVALRSVAHALEVRRFPVVALNERALKTVARVMSRDAGSGLVPRARRKAVALGKRVLRLVGRERVKSGRRVGVASDE